TAVVVLPTPPFWFAMAIVRGSGRWNGVGVAAVSDAAAVPTPDPAVSPAWSSTTALGGVMTCAVSCRPADVEAALTSPSAEAASTPGIEKPAWPGAAG